MFFFFFFNDTATTEIYTLSLHDALPIFDLRTQKMLWEYTHKNGPVSTACCGPKDRKSTRLNSSHGYISYAVFCLKKKKNKDNNYSADHSYAHQLFAFSPLVQPHLVRRPT